MTKAGESTLLGPFRVLDLTDDKGYLCGRMLGDMGADVIKIEPPQGDPGRRIGPFYQDIPHPEKSLYWFAYNLNKRGITLNLETGDGRELFQRLVKGADFLIESFAPGYMASLGLDYSALSQINPRLIMTSISMGGQSGPRSDLKPSDLVASALGGAMFVTGDADRAPVHISIPQAFLQGGEEAAIGTIIAHYHRQRTGEGQYVDVSIQESLYWNVMNSPLFWEFEKRILRRSGIHRTWSSAAAQKHRVLWPCKDGHISFTLYGGKIGATTNRAIVEWMSKEQEVPESLKQKDWDNFDLASTTEAEFDAFAGPAAKFFLNHTMDELYQGAIERDMMLYPVATIADIRKDPQLEAREFWQEVEHPELGRCLIYPGASVKLSETPLGIRRRAPLIGEHNLEIYEGELGLSREEIGLLKQSGAI
ncbi:MAG: CaiB/BaiF CoA transferase family protein [Dehalococcoidia bacterium]